MLEGLVSMEMSVLERLKWLQQQQQQQESPELLQILHGSNNDEFLQSSLSHFQMLGSGFGQNYNMGFGPYIHEDMDGCISRTSSFKKTQVDHTMDVMLKNNDDENLAIALKNKRKHETREDLKTEKKIKVEAETESNIKEKTNLSNKETYSDISKETLKGASEIQKLDYIHVRARRGQATDRHSLAERARRDKISKKMKYLQDLVPGCNKVTGKAGMLDEIINYVQSLQRQVDFLSMKLAVLNPEHEVLVEDLSVKQFQAYFTNFPTLVASKPTLMVDTPLFPLDHKGSLDLSVINTNQTTSLEAPSTSWETQTQSLYNTSCLGFQY
ncbi:unnamed protein product [Cochlearia groenlandica]